MFWAVLNAPNSAAPTAIRVAIRAAHFAVFPAAMGDPSLVMLGGPLAIEQASRLRHGERLAQTVGRLNRQCKFQLIRHRQRKDCATLHYCGFITGSWRYT